MTDKPSIWQRSLAALRTDKKGIIPAPTHVQRFFASGISLVVVFFAVQCVTGVLLSLNYIPSSSAATDGKGQPVIVARAQRDIVDRDGDTVYRKDQFCLLARSAHTGGIDYPNADSTAFDLGTTTVYLGDDRARPAIINSTEAQASQSWISVEHTITNVLPYGAAIRGLHIWSSHLLIVCVVVLLLGGLFLRVYRYSSEMRWLRLVTIALLCIFTAWLGSILPWNLRSSMSLPIVASFLEQNFPLFGTFMASLLRGDQSVLPTTLTRAFVLHAMIAPLVIAISIRGFRSLNRRETQVRPGYNLAWIIPLVLTLLWNPIEKGLESLPASTIIRPDVAHHIRPEWYLSAPFFLMQHFPEDLVASALFLWFGGLLLLPLMHARIRSQKTVAVFAWMLALGYLCAQILSLVIAR